MWEILNWIAGNSAFVSKTLGQTKKEFTADHYVDMKELIRDFQPGVQIKEENEEKIIWDWRMTEEMERLLKE